MVRRGCGRDRRFGSASWWWWWWWWCWWRRRRRKTDGDGDGDGDGMRWVGSDHLRSIGVRVDPSRVVGVRGCAGMCVRVCVHEGGGSRAASAESRIENRNRSRCRRLGLLVLPFSASAGWGRTLSLSPARVPVCGPADRWGPARLPASFKFEFCSSFPLPSPSWSLVLWPRSP